MFALVMDLLVEGSEQWGRMNLIGPGYLELPFLLKI